MLARPWMAFDEAGMGVKSNSPKRGDNAEGGGEPGKLTKNCKSECLGSRKTTLFGFSSNAFEVQVVPEGKCDDVISFVGAGGQAGCWLERSAGADRQSSLQRWSD